MKIDLFVRLRDGQITVNLANKELDLRYPGVHPYFDIDNVEYEKTMSDGQIVLNADLKLYQDTLENATSQIFQVLNDNQLLIYPDDVVNINIEGVQINYNG